MIKVVEVVRKRREAHFENVGDGEFFLFCDNLYLKGNFYNLEDECFNNAYCFEVDDYHYTFFDDDDDVEPVDVRIEVFK